MSQKEVSRLRVVRQVLDDGVCLAQAAQLLGLSTRQIKRLCRRLAADGQIWKTNVGGRRNLPFVVLRGD